MQMILKVRNMYICDMLIFLWTLCRSIWFVHSLVTFYWRRIWYCNRVVKAFISLLNTQFYKCEIDCTNATLWLKVKRSENYGIFSCIVPRLRQFDTTEYTTVSKINWAFDWNDINFVGWIPYVQVKEKKSIILLASANEIWKIYIYRSVYQFLYISPFPYIKTTS